MGDIRMRLASFSVSASLLVVVAVLGGCGDNAPKGGTGGKGGGVAGSGGSGGHGGAGAVGGAAGLGGLGGLSGLGGLGGVAGAGAGGGAGAAGAAGTAGLGGAGGTAVPCYATSFTTPASNNLTLTVIDDNDHTCADGFQYSVQISSGAVRVLHSSYCWSKTRAVGCAVADAPRREIWVCNYDPPGNVIGYRAY